MQNPIGVNTWLKPVALPKLMTSRSVIRLLEPHEAPKMLKFRLENKEHLSVWEPRRHSEFFTVGFWETQLRAALRDFRAGTNVCLVILDSTESEVLGVNNFTNIARGTFQSCHLGYSLAASQQGQGMMQEALEATTDYIFKELRLHRIMANYIPHNTRSGNLLARLGFEVEGRAKEFLLINGRWEDHVLTSKLNPYRKR